MITRLVKMQLTVVFVMAVFLVIFIQEVGQNSPEPLAHRMLTSLDKTSTSANLPKRKDSSSSAAKAVEKKNKTENQNLEHDHNDCLQAMNQANDSNSIYRIPNDFTEQEKFDVIEGSPELEAALRNYEDYMIDENGEEVLRADVEARFDAEVELLRTTSGQVGAASPP